MKRMILVHGDKGGVGKSILARALFDWMRKHGRMVDAYDTDRRNPDLSRFYNEAAVTLLDLASDTALDPVLDTLSTKGHDRALIDLAAGAGDALASAITGGVRLGEALTDMGARATVIYVISRSRPSVTGLKTALADFSSIAADFIVVKNCYFGTPEKFSRYDNSNARKEALSRGAIELAMPELLDDLYDALDQSSQPFGFAAEAEGLTFTNRRRLRSWIADCEAEIDKAAKVL